jgi:uncharacterized membrane protein
MLEEQRDGAAGAVPPHEGPVEDAPRSAFADPVTWAIVLAVFGAYLALSLSRLLTLNPMSWDLGIYTEYVKQYADLRAPIVDIRGAGFNLLGDHFQPIVALIAPFFRVFPSPATLLVAQAALTAVSVFPVVSAGFALLRPRAGRSVGAHYRARAVGLAYGFSWGLQQMVDFDFHEIAFAVPLLAFSLSALVTGRWRACVLWALPLVFVKEDQGFTVAALGLLLLWRGWRAADKRRMGGGTLLVAWGVAWSVLAIAVIIPHFNPEHHYYYWKDGGTAGSGGPFSVTGLIAQPFHGWAEKLQTVVLLLLPTAFIALGSPIALVTLPSIALRFVSTNSSYWGTMWHYNATVMPILFISAICVMSRWDGALDRGNGTPGAREESGREESGRGGDRRERGGREGAVDHVRAAVARYGAVTMVAAAVGLVFQFPLSDLWQGSTYTGGPRVPAADAAMARVPDGVTVATTLDLLAPLAARTDTFWIGNSGNPVTTYIVFDGLDSGYSPVPQNVPAFIHQMFPSAGYHAIYVNDDIYVFERG